MCRLQRRRSWEVVVRAAAASDHVSSAHREYPHTIVNTGNCVGGTNLAVTDRYLDAGESEIALATDSEVYLLPH